MVMILIMKIIFQYQMVMWLCKIIDDNHKNIISTKDIDSILKINKKMCSQVY